MNRVVKACVLALAGVVCVGAALGQGREYVRSEAMIPVRDGVKLHVGDPAAEGV